MEEKVFAVLDSLTEETQFLATGSRRWNYRGSKSNLLAKSPFQ